MRVLCRDPAPRRRAARRARCAPDRDRPLRGMLFWRLELLVYAGEPVTDYGVQARRPPAPAATAFRSRAHPLASPRMGGCVAGKSSMLVAHGGASQESADTARGRGGRRATRRWRSWWPTQRRCGARRPCARPARPAAAAAGRPTLRPAMRGAPCRSIALHKRPGSPSACVWAGVPCHWRGACRGRR